MMVDDFGAQQKQYLTAPIQYISVVDERNRRGRPPKSKKPPELEKKEMEFREQRERELREKRIRDQDGDN
jgi:hypothetical protein